MTTTIERRVSALEESAGGACPECGWNGDRSNIEYVVHWENAASPTKPDEFCGACGRQLTYTVDATWDDTPLR
jgi:predicted RNA-binding Zn-ribbon protein involved in translation (DUF1610 family)